MPPADLAADTRVVRLGAAPGWYTANLPDAWSYLSPSGGVLMTVALRAMVAELADPDFSLVSANTVFCSPVPSGPMAIRVEVLRKGNAAAQLRAALSSTSVPGPGLEVTATFARTREGPDVVDVTMPEVPPPDRADEIGRPSRLPERTHAPFFENFESRFGHGQKWWEPGWKASNARVSRWMRYLVPQRDSQGFLDPLAIPPIADTMPPSLFQKLGPNGPVLYAPSLDLTVHFLRPTRREWLLVDTYTRSARAGYASASVDIWSDDGEIVAYGTQTMMLRRPPR